MNNGQSLVAPLKDIPADQRYLTYKTYEKEATPYAVAFREHFEKFDANITALAETAMMLFCWAFCPAMILKITAWSSTTRRTRTITAHIWLAIILITNFFTRLKSCPSRLKLRPWQRASSSPCWNGAVCTGLLFI